MLKKSIGFVFAIIFANSQYSSAMLSTPRRATEATLKASKEKKEPLHCHPTGLTLTEDGKVSCLFCELTLEDSCLCDHEGSCPDEYVDELTKLEIAMFGKIMTNGDVHDRHPARGKPQPGKLGKQKPQGRNKEQFRFFQPQTRKGH